MLFFLPFVWILLRGIKRPKLVFSVAAGFIVIFGFWTYQRNALWNDPVAFWHDAVSKAPNHYRSHANLGVSYLDAKQYDRAMEEFQKALTLTPCYPTEIYTNIGLLYFESGRQDLARQNLDRAVLLNPGNYVALDLLGTLDRKQKDYSKALKHHRAAIKINPNFAPSYHNLGILYMEIGDLSNAVKAFRQALALRPMWSEAYSSLGLALAKQGRYDIAIPALRKAVKIDFKNEEALFNLALSYKMTGQYKMAVHVYETLLEIAPKDVEAMHNLGVIYMKHFGNIQQARLYFNRALATDPDYDQAAAVRNILSGIGTRR